MLGPKFIEIEVPSEGRKAISFANPTYNNYYKFRRYAGKVIQGYGSHDYVLFV